QKVAERVVVVIARKIWDGERITVHLHETGSTAAVGHVNSGCEEFFPRAACDEERVCTRDQRPHLCVETGEYLNCCRPMSRIIGCAPLDVFGAIAEALTDCHSQPRSVQIGDMSIRTIAPSGR